MKQSEPHDTILLPRVPTFLGARFALWYNGRHTNPYQDDDIYVGITDMRVDSTKLKPNKVRQADFNTSTVIQDAYCILTRQYQPGELLTAL